MAEATLTSLKTGETIELDVVELEQPEFRSEVTEHPVEVGVDVSDHVRPRPITMTIRGVVVDPGADAVGATLRKWRNEGETLYYVGINSLYNGVIENFRPEFDAQVQNGFRFELTLKHVRIAQAKMVQVSSAAVRAQVAPVTNAGLQQPKQA